MAAEVLDAQTDDDAIAAARARVGKSEVWLASRLVARVDGKSGNVAN